MFNVVAMCFVMIQLIIVAGESQKASQTVRIGGFTQVVTFASLVAYLHQRAPRSYFAHKQGTH